MVTTGDWITPRLNDTLFLNKPPLAFWLAAVSFETLGTARRGVPAGAGARSAADFGRELAGPQLGRFEKLRLPDHRPRDAQPLVISREVARDESGVKRTEGSHQVRKAALPPRSAAERLPTRRPRACPFDTPGARIPPTAGTRA